MTETPFRIAISDEQLEELRKKLALTRFPDELENASWAYGAPLADVKRLVARWRDGFDWRKVEASLNAELSMFTRDITVDGFNTLNIHYVHEKSKSANAIPLLFVHGWPGSFLEVRKILPLLVETSADHPSFHVVAISLPGFAFSEAPTKRGFNPRQYAEVGHKLMLALGYNEYVTQGGDWGSAITQTVSATYPKHAKAWHTNMPFVPGPPSFSSHPVAFFMYLITPYSQEEREGLATTQEFLATGNAYMLEQGTKPQTIGTNLADTPAGLLAWIYEKLVGWTDNYPWTDDEVLTWISIYWFSRAGPAASLRIYYEYRLVQDDLNAQRVPVPTGFSRFPRDIYRFPRTWTRTLGKVVFDRRHGSGGHFAAYERPEALVGDLRDMFGRGGPAYGVVQGRPGYN
ncbi:alpha/beta-hydrolase [Vararia minispora EC-137]|uniref:Alpha/beta-hydrolase n=1 Tax=Vararia minispora EC-137 TaxID=1314806 RepID=A0ACB8QUR6_9AGAM|nr:alpha/beta-hydrolase [Vararia minispora EC-137]